MDFNDSPNEADIYNGAQSNILQDARSLDSGYNVIWRPTTSHPGSKMRKVVCYTSSDTGNYIRDAESGQHYTERVGSADEDLYFKVSLATGECKSKNGSSTLFYSSPNQYMSHMRRDLEPREIAVWEKKRNTRIAEIEKARESYKYVKQAIIIT